MNMARVLALMPMAALIMTGCAPKFSCSEDMKGPGCASVSQVYARTHQDKPVQKAAHPAAALPQTIKPGDPLRQPGRVLRVWIAPWVDADGDYHDQSYVYLVLDHGRWFIDKARKKIQRRYAPHVTPPAKPASVEQSASGEPAPDASRVLK